MQLPNFIGARPGEPPLPKARHYMPFRSARDTSCLWEVSSRLPLIMGIRPLLLEVLLYSPCVSDGGDTKAPVSCLIRVKHCLKGLTGWNSHSSPTKPSLPTTHHSKQVELSHGSELHREHFLWDYESHGHASQQGVNGRAFSGSCSY